MHRTHRLAAVGLVGVLLAAPFAQAQTAPAAAPTAGTAAAAPMVRVERNLSLALASQIA